MSTHGSPYIYKPISELPYDLPDNTIREIRKYHDDDFYVLIADRDITIRTQGMTYFIPKGTVGGVVGGTCVVKNSWVDHGVLCTDNTHLEDSVIINHGNREIDFRTLFAHISNSRIVSTCVDTDYEMHAHIYNSFVMYSHISGNYQGVSIQSSTLRTCSLTSVAYADDDYEPHRVGTGDNVLHLNNTHMERCYFHDFSGSIANVTAYHLSCKNCTGIEVESSDDIVTMHLPSTDQDYIEVTAIRGSHTHWISVDYFTDDLGNFRGFRIGYEDDPNVYNATLSFLRDLHESWG